MIITDSQREAIAAAGNVLVLAGAGSGKTSTLVERCLHHILDPADPVGVQEMLVVTFTDAAAAEVRRRLRERLELARGEVDGAVSAHLERQIALIENADISTLHSFCLRLVRDNFQMLGLDPSVSVLGEEQAVMFMETALDAIMERHFATANKHSERVQELVEVHGGGDEQRIRGLVYKLHRYSQTLPDPAGWFALQIGSLQESRPRLWREWLQQALFEWCDRWGPVLRELPRNCFAEQFCDRVRNARGGDAVEFAALLADVARAIDPVPHGNARDRDAIKGYFEEAAFLQTLIAPANGGDPLAQDWDWIRGHMETLLRLAQEFASEYSRLKREHAALDFHDLEQFALDLLTGAERRQLTRVAVECQRKFRLILVDEYQDINAAQDTILRTVARAGRDGNRFLVGDIKQSIYRFRLANPKIFQAYNARWRESAAQGRVVALSDNFRSAAPILEFVNAFFSVFMRQELGGAEYGGDAWLRPGLSERPHSQEPCVELHLRLTEKREPEDEAEENATDDELEARMVALRLRDLKNCGHPVWDPNDKKTRLVRWSDMVVLLRSPGPRADIYLKEFSRAGVPLEAERGGIYDSAEVSDLLSLLQILDNPLQDVPLLAVLRSPLVGLSLDELAHIREAHRTGLFWTALKRWRDLHRGNRDAAGTWTKVDCFIERFARWRKMGRHSALSERLEAALGETHYMDCLRTQSRPAQREANVRRFVGLAGQFDPVQRQGLPRFLRFVEAQRVAETDSEPIATDNPDAVRLMSVHKSKGLEFPVTALAGLGTRFNARDLSENVLLDEDYGVCAVIRPPGSRSSYPSLPWWLARQRQRREMIGEELRLLYVAMTRARDTLLLFGSANRKGAENRWPEALRDVVSIAKASNPLAWLGPWCAQQIGEDCFSKRDGTTSLFRWRVYADEDLRRDQRRSEDKPVPKVAHVAELEALAGRLNWRYPFGAATHESAKLSVTALRGVSEEAEPRFAGQTMFKRPRRTTRLSAAEIGTAHHLFLQLIDLRKSPTVRSLRAQAGALVEAQVLMPEQAESLDLAAIAQFWNSPIGVEILSSKAMNREVPFTARFTRDDLIEASLNSTLSLGEFIVVQGTIDLAVILPDEIWIADFKTDRIAENDCAASTAAYGPQLRLYASALARIYRRPVTRRWLHFLSLSHTSPV